ncbi:MAG: type I-E CRISPR-associated protein Cas7/Cse4/CasC [Deltaproteobacteria bacterium]|jgi:CRISPR system Cascade subunit CasC|nr:type I-E CRISPR-associated protein Cas7/Cse4/CasC [Deltaproteobacteria bacterium]
MLVEVHMLQNHAPSNLNRDDSGSPKEAVFGGFKRARISSQCLKRTVRRSDVFIEKMGGLLGTRTRMLPELVRNKLLEKGLNEEMAALAAQKTSGFGNKDGTEQKENKSGYYRTAQTMFLNDADVNAVVDVLYKAAMEAKTAKDFEKVKAKDLQEKAKDNGFRPMSVDVALFGRMVTSEAFVDVEASCQFAHAISTHKVDHEFDYYTAMDDLERSSDDEAGAGADMIGDVEFNSACYYKYFNVHIDGLVDNLTGKSFRREVKSDDEKEARATAAKAVQALIEAACSVTPSGKQNTFAAHQWPSLVWVEIRDSNLPVSYTNAFSVPVNPKLGDGIEMESAKRLKKECEDLTSMYSLKAGKRLLLSKNRGITILDVVSSENLEQLLKEVEKVVKACD